MDSRRLVRRSVRCSHSHNDRGDGGSDGSDGGGGCAPPLLDANRSRQKHMSLVAGERV